MSQRYGWDTGYSYNVFGADEHYVVTLYKLSHKGNWKPIESWGYSTYLAPRLAHRRAERRIRRLKETYDAESI